MHSVTIDKSPSLNLPIELTVIQVLSFVSGDMVWNDVHQIEKNQIATKAQDIFYSLVSQQQKLCKTEQSEDQTPSDAALNGPQGGMATLKLLIILLNNYL